MWDGRFANNGWLQELPKPLTKLTWDATAWISPQLARERSLEDGDVIELRYRGNTARMPIFRVPGHPGQSVTVFFGYGRRMAGSVGNATKDTESFNAFLLRTSDAPWFGNGLEIAKTGERYPLATTQEHHLMEARALGSNARAIQEQPAIIKEMRETFPAPHDVQEIRPRWGDRRSIWSSSTVAARARPPASPKTTFRRRERAGLAAGGREMHWIRIDHYFMGKRAMTPQSKPTTSPSRACGAELVCPVAATSHSSEGLNDMAYPTDAWHSVLLEQLPVQSAPVSISCSTRIRRYACLYPMRNPDVSVRSRGVMEKCTYCVQRINQRASTPSARIREIRDGEIVTACQAVCPSDAIVFGNAEQSQQPGLEAQGPGTQLPLLGRSNTRPRTTYLAARCETRMPSSSPRLRGWTLMDTPPCLRAAAGHRAGTYVRYGHGANLPRWSEHPAAPL